MILKMRTVTVHEIPEALTANEERNFLRSLQPYMETERPRLVLDCSRILHFDNRAIHLLLSCLEEAMKHNGDVRLASLAPDARIALTATGVDRIFEIYPTTTEAVRSFQNHPASAVPLCRDSGDLNRHSESAA